MSGVGWSDSRIVGWGLSLALLLSVYPTIRLSAKCRGACPPRCGVAARPAAPASNSVGVLYFDNLSRDTADAYLADGLTDEIITRLGQVERLTVKSGSAVRRFRGVATDDPAGLGRALGVAHLVTGSVRRIGSGLRVTVELVRAATGVHVWGEQYDRGDADVLAVEEAVSRAVVTGITGRLLPGERATLASRPTTSTDAFDHFLRGNHYLAQRALTQATAQYETAVRLDPQFADALARSALGYALSLDWDLYPGVPPDSLLGRGEAAAARALQLNPRSSDAWMTRGYLLTFHNPLTYDGVAEALRQAIAIDPRNAEAYHFRGVILAELGEDSAAAEATHQALAIDPLRAITLNALGRVEMMAYRRASWLAIGLVAAGEAERALDLLGGLRRSRRLWYALRFPEFDAVRRNPRFQRLVEESRPMGAPR